MLIGIALATKVTLKNKGFFPRSRQRIIRLIVINRKNI